MGLFQTYLSEYQIVAVAKPNAINLKEIRMHSTLIL